MNYLKVWRGALLVPAFGRMDWVDIDIVEMKCIAIWQYLAASGEADGRSRFRFGQAKAIEKPGH
jgi:hypothetical protein